MNILHSSWYELISKILKMKNIARGKLFKCILDEKEIHQNFTFFSEFRNDVLSTIDTSTIIISNNFSPLYVAFDGGFSFK